MVRVEIIIINQLNSNPHLFMTIIVFIFADNTILLQAENNQWTLNFAISVMTNLQNFRLLSYQ